VKADLRGNLTLGWHEIINYIHESLTKDPNRKEIQIQKTNKDAAVYLHGRHPGEDGELEALCAHSRKLWSDRGVQSVWKRRGELPCLSNYQSMEYLMTHLDRIILRPESDLEEEDILRARSRTTGRHVLELDVDRHVFKFADVGGQRSERRRWDDVEEPVNAVIFFAALTDWNLPTRASVVVAERRAEERMKKNKGTHERAKTSTGQQQESERPQAIPTCLDETLDIWESQIIRNPLYKDSMLILMLNKFDIFKKDFDKKSFAKQFSQHSNLPEDAVKAAQFIGDLFLERVPEEKKQRVYVHTTCALDTDQMRPIVLSLRQDVINQMLGNLGIVH
jgi:hypothetical protein